MAVYEIETADGAVYEVETNEPAEVSFSNEAAGIRNRFVEGATDLVDFVASAERNLNPFRPGGARVFGLNENLLNKAPEESFKEGVTGLLSKVNLYDERKPETALGTVLGETAYYAPGAIFGGVVPTLAAGASAGTAKAAGFDEVGQLVAGLFGGAAPAAIKGIGAKAGQLADDFMSIFSKSGQAETAKDVASGIVKNVVQDPAAAISKIDEFTAANQALPYIQRTSPKNLEQYKRTAEILDNQGVATFEEGIKRLDPTAGQVAISQDAAREAARKTIFQGAAPKPMLESEVGQTIREAAAAGKEEAGDLIQELASKAFKGNETIKISDAKRVLTGTVNSFVKDGSRDVAPDFLKKVENFKNLPPNVDLKTLQNYRSAFGEYMNLGASPTTEQRFTAQLASNIRTLLDDAVDNAVQKNLPKDQAVAWREMIDARKVKGATFEQGAVGDILEKRPFGAGFEVAAENIPQKVLATKEDAKQLFQAIGGNAEARDAARSSIFSKIWERSQGKNGFSQVSFDRQLSALEEVIPEVLTPWQRKALNKISADLGSQFKTRGSAFKVSQGQSATAQLEYGIEAIQSAVREGSETAVRKVARKIPIVGDIAEAVLKKFSDPEVRTQLVNKELAKFVLVPEHAKMLLSRKPKEVESALKLFKSELLKSIGGTAQGSANIAAQKEEPIISEMFQKREQVPMADEMFKKTNFKAVEQEIDADPYFSALYETESGRNPNAKNPTSSASGGFQFVKATAKAMGLEDPFDLAQSFDAVKRLTAEHQARFGDDPTTLYAAHYLGSTLLNKWKSGAALSDREQKLVESLEKQALPRFIRIFNKVSKNKPTMV